MWQVLSLKLDIVLDVHEQWIFFFFLKEGGGGGMMKLSNFFQLWIQIKTNNNLSPKMWV